MRLLRLFLSSVMMIRRSTLLLMVLVILAPITDLPAYFPQSKTQVESAAGHLKPGDKVHPTDKAPKNLRSMIQDGTVTLVFSSDPDFVKDNIGKAHFYLRMTQKYAYGFSKTKKNELWQVKVTAKNVEPTVRVEHVVRLPVKYKADAVWNGRLLRHEFDHVAVSLDPRPVLLLEHLCRKLPPLEQTLAAGEEPSDAVYKRIINEEIDRRRDAVNDLIQTNYVLLDQVSKHGTMAIPKRAEFFGKLYTKENLAEQKFPFVAEVLELLESPVFQQAELRYLPRDPTEK